MIKVEEFKRENGKCVCEGEQSVFYTCGTLKKIVDDKRDTGIRIQMNFNNKNESSNLTTTYWNEETLSEIKFDINYCPICGRKI